MTPAQMKTLQIARSQTCFSARQDREEKSWRLLLWNIGHVRSSKELTNSAFEDVMAVLEDSGFRDKVNGKGYWQNKVKARGAFSGERACYKIAELIAQTKYQLRGLVLQFSHDRTDDVTKLTPREAYALLEMLKDAAGREARQQERGALQPPSPPLFPGLAPSAKVAASPPRRVADSSARPGNCQPATGNSSFSHGGDDEDIPF